MRTMAPIIPTPAMATAMDLEDIRTSLFPPKA